MYMLSWVVICVMMLALDTRIGDECFYLWSQSVVDIVRSRSGVYEFNRIVVKIRCNYCAD